MLERIFTKNNFLRSFLRAVIFTLLFFGVKLMFYFLDWEEKENFHILGFIIYFSIIFLLYFILDGRDYTWREVFRKNENNKK